MKLYTVTYDSPEGGCIRTFRATKREAKAFAADLMEEDSPDEQDGSSNPIVSRVEVPTTKAKLIEWLNSNATGEAAY